jgi:transcriptional regulator with XRE-family HTH domain
VGYTHNIANLLIGHRIRTARKLKGFSQQKLAEGIIDQSVLSRIENGVLDPYPDVLLKLNERLGDNVISQYIKLLESKSYDMASLIGVDANSVLDALKSTRSAWGDVHYRAAIQLCQEYVAKAMYSQLRETCALLLGQIYDGPYYVTGSYYMGLANLFEGKYNEAIELFFAVEEQIESLDSQLKPRLYYNTCYAHFGLESYVQALWYAKLAAHQFKAMDDFAGYSKSLALLGAVEGRIGKFKDAERHLLESYSLGEKWGMNSVDKQRIELTLADVYDSQGEVEAAKEWCQKVILHGTDTNDHTALAASYRILSRLFYGEKDHAKAREYFELSVEHAELSGDCKAAAWSYLHGTVIANDLESRIRYGLLAYKVTLYEKGSLVHAMAAEVLAKLFLEKGDKKAAYRYLEMATFCYRTLVSRNTSLHSLLSFLPIFQ